MSKQSQREQLQASWNSKRFEGVSRPYSVEDVLTPSWLRNH